MIDVKTAKSIRKFLKTNGQLLDVRFKMGIDVFCYKVEDDDVAEFPCLKGAEQINTWVNGIEIHYPEQRSYSIDFDSGVTA